MKMSGRDKKLLLILLVLAVFCVPYFTVISPLQEENLTLQQEIMQAQERNRYLVSLSTQENYYKEEAKKLAVEQEKVLARFPDKLPQEATLLFLSDMEKRFSISLMQVVYGMETAADVTSTAEEPAATDQTSVSQREAELTEAAVAEIEAALSGTESAGQTATQVALTKDMIGKCVTSEYTYSVGYQNWKEFMYAILQTQDRMVITAMDAAFVEGGKVEGSFTMSQYAIEGAGRDAIEVQTPATTHGTTNIFRQAAGKGNAEAAADFFLMLSPAEADVDAKVFGRAEDASEETYLKSSSNDKQEIRITFQGEGGSYTAFCQIGDVTYEEGGIAFAKEGMINLEILSTPRLSEKDTAGAVIHINNETDTTLGVTVLDDDAEQPRADIRTKTGAILMK